MRLLYPLLFLTFLTPFISLAQNNYKPGYVVNLNGDTTHGFIAYKAWDKNPKTIIFKTDEHSAQKEQYSTSNAIAFGINGIEKYKRFALWISHDEVSHSEISAGSDTSKKFDTVFLRVITAGGSVTLYAYNDKVKQRFFISEKDKAPVELVYYTTADPDNQANSIVKAIYKNQLQKLVAVYKPNDQHLIDEVQTVDYKDYDLEKIVLALNGSQYSATLTSKRGGIAFFAGVGVNNSTVTYLGTDELNGKSSNSVFPQINAGADLYFDKNSQRFVLRFELGYTLNKVQLTTTYGESDTYAINVEHYSELLKFNQSIISFYPQLIWNIYNADNLKFYIDAGLAINYNLYNNEVYNITTYYSASNTQDTEPRAFPVLHTVVFNVPLKAGVFLAHRFAIYAGYTPKTALNSLSGFAINLSSYQAGVDYFFGKK